MISLLFRTASYITCITWLIMLVLRVFAGMGSWWYILGFIAITAVLTVLSNIFRPLTAQQKALRAFIKNR